MESSLTDLAADALRHLAEDEAQAALMRWSASFANSPNPGGDDGAASDPETFASEAAFAAAARSLLTARVGRPQRFAALFPHIYGSPLFSWYEPDDALRRALDTALAAGADGDEMEVLGWLYQFSIPPEIRKRFGQFYTGAAVVTAMLDGIGFAGPATLSGRLIDPACGAGAFLIEATRRVIAAAAACGLNAVETCRAVQRVIHALDLNPLGALLTEAAIGLLLAPYLTQLPDHTTLEPLHLYVTDALRSDGLEAEIHHDVASQIKQRSGAYADGFTWVVANPPYAKYPSRLFDGEQRRRFAATTYGHPNLYGLFLQVGVELLADGGRIAYINPRSFVSGLYFRNLRRFLTTHLDLERFDTFDKRTGLFDGVLQDVVIITATRRPQRQAEIELREFAGPPTGAPARTALVKRSSVLLGDSFDHAFFIPADERAHRILDHMTTDSTSLGKLGYQAVTGTIVWNRLKPHVRHESSDDARPLIWGNGLRTFRCLRLGNRAGEATHMAIVPKTRNLVSFGDALLIKRMTAKEEARRLVACRVPDELASDPNGYFAENHVNLLRAAPDAPVDLDAVLGLLNSRLFDYAFRALNGNTQVSASELEMLPVRPGPLLDRISEISRELTASGGVGDDLWRELDQTVCELYGLSNEDTAALLGSDARMNVALAA